MPYNNFDMGEYDCRIFNQGFSRINNDKQTPYFFLEFFPQVDGADAEHSAKIELYVTEGAVARTASWLERTFHWEGRWTELEPGGGFVCEGIVKLVCGRNKGGYEQWDIPMQRRMEHVSGIAPQLDKLFGKAKPKAAPAKQGQVADTQDIPF